MVAVTWRMRVYFFRPELLREKPLAVHTLACMDGVVQVTMLAARPDAHDPNLPGLLEFRRRCVVAVLEVVRGD